MKGTPTKKVLCYPLKRSALEGIYKVSAKTFRAWLRDIDISHNKTLSPADLKNIICYYGLPDGVEVII